MRSHFSHLVTVCAAALCGLAMFAASASAATTLGDQCTATVTGPGPAFSTQPAFVSSTGGVISSWGSNLAGGVDGFFQLVVMRSLGEPNWTVDAVSPTVALSSATNVFSNVRISIGAGNAIGMGSTSGLYGCDGPGPIRFSSVNLTPTVGMTFAAMSTPNVDPSVWAKVEPDADKDGFGDETQDSCPQSAKFQTACPVANAIGKAKAGKSAIALSFANPGETTLSATAKVKIPKHGRHKARTLKFKSKPVAVANGSSGKLTLKYPSALKSALKNLSTKKKLKVTITVTSTGLANTATKSYKLKLSGKKNG